MDWLATIGDSWLTGLEWLAGLALVFGLLARWMPCNPGMYWWKDLRAASTDFLYWILMPLFVNLCRTLLLAAGVKLLQRGQEASLIPVAGLPLWVQAVLILVVEDVLLYWIHRLFHSRAGWRFHAIHHSPRMLDWMATVRFHPVNDLLTLCVPDVIMLLLGFSPLALVLLSPINTVYSAMVHANLRWTFGPLRYVFASPVFHRWHHTTQQEGIDKNFASTFPVLDLVFGTFYMPAGKLPEQFGNGERDFPQDFWGQVLYPFRGRQKSASTAAVPERQPA